MNVSIRQNGNALPTVRHEGQTWTIAPAEGSYEIVLHNNSSTRKLAVVSIDGLSVIDGQPASRDGTGYVLGPYELLVIPGWRRSDREVAAFTFGHNDGSYSEQMGHGKRNTGVVGVVVYDEIPRPRKIIIERVVERIIERPRPIPWIGPYPWSWPYPYPAPHVYTVDPDFHPDVILCNADIPGDAFERAATFQCSTQTTKGMRSAELPTAGLGPKQGGHRKPCSTRSLHSTFDCATEDFDLGTGYGERQEMRTQNVTFDRCPQPSEEIVLRYGTKTRLRKLGVPVDDAVAEAMQTAPDPFPASTCAPPPSWRG
jgi:hypothetical protein